MEFVHFAFEQLHQLCKDLKLSGLLYQVGKEFTCKNCSEVDFFVVASQEQGSTPEDLEEFEGECDSCACAVRIEELLSRDLEQTNDRLSEYTAMTYIHARMHTHTHRHMNAHTPHIHTE